MKTSATEFARSDQGQDLIESMLLPAFHSTGIRRPGHWLGRQRQEYLA